LERWCNPARRFHGIWHLIAVLEKIDELSQEASCPPLVRLAAFYHGVVLSTNPPDQPSGITGEDHTLSAQLAHGQLLHLGLEETKTERICDLINGLTSRPPVAPEPDLAVLCDSERAVLASDPRAYRAYSAALRQEFSNGNLESFLLARVAVLQGWLRQERCFSTAAATAWEDAARNNIEAELIRCRQELIAKGNLNSEELEATTVIPNQKGITKPSSVPQTEP
jgi:predicted metal-dependent HD superfamily phosphohydrolase